MPQSQGNNKLTNSTSTKAFIVGVVALLSSLLPASDAIAQSIFVPQFWDPQKRIERPDLGSLVVRKQREYPVGSGLLSLVPILLLALAPGPRLLVVEEPELHLHPRLQASVGDILAGVARRPGSCCIVETHSEHVLLRILRRIRETTEDDPGLAGNLRLACQDLAIACVHRQPEATIRIYLQPDAPVLVPNSDGQSKVRPILAGPDGRILSEDWPDGFLTERIREMKIDPLMNGAME